MCTDFYFIYLYVLYCHVKCAFCHIFNKEVNEWMNEQPVNFVLLQKLLKKSNLRDGPNMK